MIRRIWTGHRIVVIAVSAVAAVAIVVAGLLVVVRPGGVAHASETPTTSPAVEPSLSLSDTATPEPTPSPTETPEGPPTPLPADWAYADLDGVAAPQAVAHNLPIAIMVDDNIVARPQSGISSASIVYQAPADGGEDRYMMVFQEGTANDIGPVRSARPYFVYWAAEYKAGFGHYGGDITSLTQVIPSMSKYIYNMDALSNDSCPYHRITTRAAPHNAYTNTAILLTCAAKLKQPAAYQGAPVRTFVDDTPFAQLPESESITIPYRTGPVGYQFDRATDSYLRMVDGNLDKDPANNQQVFAKNVIVLFQVLTYDSASDPGHNRPVITSIGSGKAIVFKEGRAIPATWKKTSDSALTRLYDASGNEIPLVRGEIFIQSVPPGTAVTYT